VFKNPAQLDFYARKFSEIRDWLSMAFEVSLLKPAGEPSFGNFRF